MNNRDNVGLPSAALPSQRGFAASIGFGAAVFLALYFVLGTLLFILEGGPGARPTSGAWLTVYMARSSAEGFASGYATARRRGIPWQGACGVLAALTALFSILFAAAFCLHSAAAHFVAVLLGGWFAARRAV